MTIFLGQFPFIYSPFYTSTKWLRALIAVGPFNIFQKLGNLIDRYQDLKTKKVAIRIEQPPSI